MKVKWIVKGSEFKSMKFFRIESSEGFQGWWWLKMMKDDEGESKMIELEWGMVEIVNLVEKMKWSMEELNYGGKVV